MHPFQWFLNQTQQAKEELAKKFANQGPATEGPAKVVPIRSVKTSIMLWEIRRPLIRKALEEIAFLANRAHDAEAAALLRLLSKLENRLERIKMALSGALDSPDSL
jgi:hypothetical protein